VTGVAAPNNNRYGLAHGHVISHSQTFETINVSNMLISFISIFKLKMQ